MLNKLHFKQLAWAFYLACSWTWCIGMFLPVILQNDFGNGAWLFFIVCNVVGATAFSFFITSHDKSQNFVEQHITACTLFSAITIIFQLFFMGWVFSYLSSIDVLCALMLLGVLYLTIKFAGFSVPAMMVWILSLIVFVIYMDGQPNVAIVEKLTDQVIAINPSSFYALPLLAFGFLLCPYLDLTFHRVVQAAHTKAERGNRVSFLIGFPILFATLMIFSLVYADTASQILLNPHDVLAQHTLLIKCLFFYFIMQTGFTGIVHWIELKKHFNNKQLCGLGGGIIVALGFGIFSSIPMNEIAYRIFMSFYGIIAPAYIWILAFNRKSISKNIFLIGTTLSLMLSAIPLFFHNAQYYYWYPVAVGVVLATRFFSVKN